LETLVEPRKRGPRKRNEVTWRAHLLLDSRHLDFLERRAAAEGRTLSAELRHLLDRAQAEESR
jgi:hypothetical protein